MKKYEILYIVDASLSDEDKEKTISQVTALVTDNGGVAEEPDKWGIRKYAYPISYKQEGYYVLMNVTCSKEAQIEIDRQMRNDENIIRQMILKK